MWNSLLNRIPDAAKSPHFRPEYYKLFEERGEGRPICFVGVEGDRAIVYPALINSIHGLGYELEGEYFDLQGAYGYNGPVTNCGDPTFLEGFSRAVSDYCREAGIVAEFIRFCPVIKNYHYLRHIEPSFAFENVLIDLAPGIDEVWRKSFDNGVRKAVRKAERAKLDCRIVTGTDVTAEDVGHFLNIYHQTMVRNRADAYYFFSQDFVHGLIASMPGETLLAFVSADGRPVSCELVLHNTHHAYGFLGGTLSDYYAQSPNSLLRFELVKRLSAMGIQAYSIGGGKGMDDPVYLFKKSFGRNTESRFYIGKCIHNEDVYRSLCKQWARKYPEKDGAYGHLLLKYRY